MRSRIVSLLSIAALAFACGRREHRAFFDAEPPPPPPSVIAPPLPPGALSVRWGEIRVPAEMRAGSTAVISVSFMNKSSVTWPDNAAANSEKRDGSYAVRLNHSWAARAASLDERKGGGRANLPHSIAAGETATVAMAIRAPDAPGEYQLVIELLQENVQWFPDRFTTPVRVLPAVPIRK